MIDFRAMLDWRACCLHEMSVGQGGQKERQMMVFATIGVDYDEWNPETYRGIYVMVGGGEQETFSGGTPREDFRRAVQYCRHNNYDWALSSTVDNFAQDGGVYVMDGTLG